MSRSRRRNQYDVTDTVQVSHFGEVHSACADLLHGRYPAADLQPLETAFDIFARLYAGLLPGYLGCDTWYHDAQHSLDCALATARLLDGHERSVPAARRLGPRRCVLGVIAALYHDAGYVRRSDDAAVNGAEYTASHVRRSAEILAGLLPQLGFAGAVAGMRQWLHYTGFELPLTGIRVDDVRDRTLGFLVASADLLSQMADRCYPEKCRDFLFRELAVCGVAGAAQTGRPPPVYDTARTLLQQTPEFVHRIWSERLDGYFGGVYRCMAVHFGGEDPYLAQIEEHVGHIRCMSGASARQRFNRRPRVIGAAEMRRQLALTAAEIPARQRAA